MHVRTSSCLITHLHVHPMNMYLATVLYLAAILLIFANHFLTPHIKEMKMLNRQHKLKIRFNEMYDTGVMHRQREYYLKIKKIVRYYYYFQDQDIDSLFVFSDENGDRVDGLLERLDFRVLQGVPCSLPPLFNFGIWFPLLCPIFLNMVVVLKRYIKERRIKKKSV